MTTDYEIVNKTEGSHSRIFTIDISSDPVHLSVVDFYMMIKRARKQLVLCRPGDRGDAISMQIINSLVRIDSSRVKFYLFPILADFVLLIIKKR